MREGGRVAPSGIDEMLFMERLRDVKRVNFIISLQS